MMKNMPKKSKHWDQMVAILDHCFPKGETKERGKAILMLSYIELMLLGVSYKIDDATEYAKRGSQHKTGGAGLRPVREKRNKS